VTGSVGSVSVEHDPKLRCSREVEGGNHGGVVGLWVLAVDREGDGLVVEELVVDL
jgi:hypothetical protein